MEVEIGKTLMVHGPLGVIAIVSLAVAARLYRDRERDREQHKREMNELQQRYVAKAETWMEKYHELARSLNDVLESITKRYGRD